MIAKLNMDKEKLKNIKDIRRLTFCEILDLMHQSFEATVPTRPRNSGYFNF